MSGVHRRANFTSLFFCGTDFLVLKIIKQLLLKIILSACFYKGALVHLCVCVQADFGGGSPKGEGVLSLVSYTWMSLGAEVGVVNSLQNWGTGS